MAGHAVKQKFDLLALGAVAVDDLLYAAYPGADEKAEVQRRERQCGGMSAIALITAARLGCSCAYAGVLGRDELSEFAAGEMRKEGVNLRHLARRKGVQPIHSVIIIDSKQGSRNIFFDVAGVVGAAKDWPPPAVLQSAKVLFVDWFSVPGMIRAARLARQAGIPVVADFEQKDVPGFSDLLELPDHLIISQAFARTLTGQSDPRRALKKLWKKHHQVVGVTCGVEGCWYLSADNTTPRHQPAFKVRTMDTTGCGDVFHGAYAAALAEGMNVTERIRFASAVAGLKAARPGAQKGIPTRPETEKFLRQFTP
jgi:sugar/nucleoside kinase (ribokinase family)